MGNLFYDEGPKPPPREKWDVKVGMRVRVVLLDCDEAQVHTPSGYVGMVGNVIRIDANEKFPYRVKMEERPRGGQSQDYPFESRELELVEVTGG